MARSSKPNRPARIDKYRERHQGQQLLRKLGTPDGVRALGEFIRNTSGCFVLWYIVSGRHPLTETVLRAAAAFALSKAVARIE